MMFAAALVFFLIGVVLLYVGYLIGVRGMTHLIAGYDAERVYDEAGLARWSGGCAALMGGFGVLAGLAMAVWPERLGLWALLFGGAVLALTVAASLGARRFERHPSAS